MRKEKVVVIDAEGRDKGKHYFLREMPASQAEKWAARAILMLARSGVELPDGIEDQGLAAVARIGIRALAGVSFAEGEPLMDEMMGCVQIIPDPSRDWKRNLVEDDIEEIATRVKLRMEVFELITGFSVPVGLSKRSQAGTSIASSGTQTSPQP